MTTIDYPALFKQYLSAAQSAVAFADQNWTHSAITRERIKRLNEARQPLTTAAPDIESLALQAAQARETALDSLRPKTGDEVTIASHAWSKVERLLNAKRDIGVLIDSADRATLTAVLDQFPVVAAERSPEPEAAIAEVQERVLGRLAALGDPQGQEALSVSTEARRAAAWGRVFAESLTRGEASTDAWSAVHAANPADFEDEFVVSLRKQVQHLDSIGG